MTRLFLVGRNPLPNGELRSDFLAAEHRLIDADHEVINPDFYGPTPDENARRKRDLIIMLGCDAVATLDGWDSSDAGNLIVYVARSTGMLVRPVGVWVQT